MEQDEVEKDVGTPSLGSEQVIDLEKAEAFRAKLEAQQNLPLGIVGGVVAAIIGASIWAVITVITKFQIGWMAVGVGFLVGYAVSALGRGLTQVYGIVGAVCALLGCLLGNILSTCGFIAGEESISIFRVVMLVFSQPSVIADLLTTTFNPMDLIFYGIAVYEGYKFSFRQITPLEKADLYQ